MNLEPEVFVRESSYVVQKYIKYPALWNDYKFDFRIYVLVTTVIDPVTIFLFNDGLVRLATEKYTNSGKADAYVHLTNYSLNKKNENFNEDIHKLKLSNVLKGTLTQKPYKPGKKTAIRSSEDIWADIESIVVKTVLTVQPQLQHIYRSCQQKEPDCCCELLGFDIMLDAKLKPWLIEVNHTPSFQCDTQIDTEVKEKLLTDTFDLLSLSVEQRRKAEFEMRQER
jgi:tubulin polyglutamylase TTLL6/13